MELRKILLILGLLLAPLSGGTIYYLYHVQTKEITILQIKANLGHFIEPGTKITDDLLEPKTILQKDLPPDPMLPGSIDKIVYAKKYLYPSDPLLASKVTDQQLTYKEVDQRIIAIKPADLGLVGLVQLDDLITIVTPNFSLSNIKVVGTTDATGNVLSVIPQFVKNEASSNSMLNIANPVNPAQSQSKGADHLLVLVTKDSADLISKLPKESIMVIFEKRPSLPDGK